MKPMKAKLTMKQLVILLQCASAAMYLAHYLIFRDLHHLAIFGLHELAFVPLEVILVTLGLDQLVEKNLCLVEFPKQLTTKETAWIWADTAFFPKFRRSTTGGITCFPCRGTLPMTTFC